MIFSIKVSCIRRIIVFFLASIVLSNFSEAQTPYVENKKLQMTPATLNLRITQNKNVPVILNIGTEGKIKGSLQVGIMSERKDSDLLQRVKSVSKSKAPELLVSASTIAHFPACVKKGSTESRPM